MYEEIRDRLEKHVLTPESSINTLEITEQERDFLLDWIKKVNGLRRLTRVESVVILENIVGSSSSASVSPW